MSYDREQQMLHSLRARVAQERAVRCEVTLLGNLSFAVSAKQ